MKKLLIILSALMLCSCIRFVKKGYDVRKTADNVTTHITEQKQKLRDSYKKHVRFYRSLIKSGLTKKQAPMPQLLKKTLEMKKLAVEANAIMKRIKLKSTRMRQIADGKDKIPETEPEYQEIEELTAGLEEEISKLERVAKKYGDASNEFSSIARDNDLYLVNTENLRLQAEKLEAILIDRGNKARADLKKARAKAKTREQKNVVKEMTELAKEILDKGREIQGLLDKLLDKLDGEEVAVGPHSDPKVTIKRVEEIMEEMKSMMDDYYELRATL